MAPCWFKRMALNATISVLGNNILLTAIELKFLPFNSRVPAAITRAEKNDGLQLFL